MNTLRKDPVIECLFMFIIDDLRIARHRVNTASKYYEMGNLQKVKQYLSAVHANITDALSYIDEMGDLDVHLQVEESLD